MCACIYLHRKECPSNTLEGDNLLYAVSWQFSVQGCQLGLQPDTFGVVVTCSPSFYLQTPLGKKKKKKKFLVWVSKTTWLICMVEIADFEGIAASISVFKKKKNQVN